jgi:hypothetical protein
MTLIDNPFEGGFVDAAIAYGRLDLHVFPCKPGAKVPLISNNLKLATNDEERIRYWWRNTPTANIGIAMEPSGLVGVDIDPRNGGEETWAEIRKNLAPELLETVTALTPSGGQHLIFRANDYSVHSGAHVFGQGVDIRARGGYLVVAPSEVKGAAYRWEVGYSPADREFVNWSDELNGLQIRNRPSSVRASDGARDARSIQEGSRNNTLFHLALVMMRDGLSFQSMFAALSTVNDQQCQPPLPILDIETIARSASRYVAQAAAGDQVCWEDSTPWPSLNDTALHGFIGELVDLIAPHTEADKAALLATALTLFGNAVGNFDGSSPYVKVGAVKHPPRIFALLSGETAKARKGQSYAEIRRIYAEADGYLDDAEVSGLSTGEGLINHVRDPEEPRKGNEEPEKVDKRAFVHESEFARVLTAAGRTECTLSPVLRDAWDVRTLRVLTRNRPLVAHSTYISVLGHITQDELVRKITDTDITNGLLNRFIILAVRRTKLLPSGGSFPDNNVKLLGERLRSLIERGRRIREVTISPSAAAVWDKLYRTGFLDEKGLAGAAVARGEAQTLRLSLIYALIDEGALCFGEHVEIQSEHIRAAYALWQYAEASTKHIFGKRLGNPTADRLLAELRDIFPRELDFTEQRDLFGRHAKESQLNEARSLLEQRHLIVTTTIPTNGRPKRVSMALPPATADDGSALSDETQVFSLPCGASVP